LKVKNDLLPKNVETLYSNFLPVGKKLRSWPFVWKQRGEQVQFPANKRENSHSNKQDFDFQIPELIFAGSLQNLDLGLWTSDRPAEEIPTKESSLQKHSDFETFQYQSHNTKWQRETTQGK
jgi:hypothetical protein